VSPDYPSRHARRVEAGACHDALRLRPAAFDTGRDILLLLDYLESRQDVARRGRFSSAPAGRAGRGHRRRHRRRPAPSLRSMAGRMGALISHALAIPTSPRRIALRRGCSVTPSRWACAAGAERYVAGIGRGRS